MFDHLVGLAFKELRSVLSETLDTKNDTKTLKYLAGVKQGQSYHMEERNIISLRLKNTKLVSSKVD